MKYTIKDADGNVTNTIKASAEFVEANYEHYELFVEPTVEAPTAAEAGRMWRDIELSSSDIASQRSSSKTEKAKFTLRSISTNHWCTKLEGTTINTR